MLPILRKIFAWFILFGVFIGCTGNKMVRQENVGYQSKAISTVKEGKIPEYRLGYGDVVEIKFFNNERFNETVTVRPDGRITLQRVGDIQVNGMRPSVLDTIITESYSQFVIDPDVTVFVREFGGNQVYILGEVNQPGGFPIQQNMNLLQAIASAGGAKNSAKLSSVVVLRKKSTGKIEATKVNLSGTIHGREDSGSTNLVIQPQDIVFVPKTFIANISTFMNQIYDGFLPPLDSYIRFLYWSR